VSETTQPTREQVANQCKVVASLAASIAGVYSDYAEMFSTGGAALWIEAVDERTAVLMEVLGDILNGMDAATADDDWMIPIFKEAQRLWPGAGMEVPRNE
jgi:hypothetical protein